MAASVYKCVEKKSNIVRAVKKMRTDDEEKMQAAANEYELLKSLEHPNIIEVYQNYLDTLRNTMYTVMEFAPGLTLQGLIEENGP
jgi:serine/threonine protein kinase